jgi:AcrR family transcriptional regulator
LTKITEICDRVQLLFQEYGIKSLTMDDIANKLGCSKKTLYVFFENRKDLVLKVISNDMKKHELEISNVIAEKLHPIEEILSLNVIAINKLKTCHPSFQYDLKKYYPQSWNIFDKKNRQLTYKVSIQNLKKGINEGCYRKEINPEIISKIFSEKIDVIFNSLAFEAINVSFSDVYKELINHHILGIVNEEGRKYYLNFQKTTK